MPSANKPQQRRTYDDLIALAMELGRYAGFEGGEVVGEFDKRELELLAEQSRRRGVKLPGGVVAGNNSSSEASSPAGGGEPISHSDGRSHSVLDSDVSHEKSVTNLLKLDVLGHVQGGKVKVFSEFHRRTEIIPDVGRLSYDNLLIFAGMPAKTHVMRSAADDIPNMVPMSEVRSAIALQAGYKRIADETELGSGCWEGVTETGQKYPSVVLVGCGEAAEWNGCKRLKRIDHPRCGGHLLDFDSGIPWYDFDKIGQYLRDYDDDFAQATKQEAIDLFSRWRWKCPATSPMVAAGLVFSTWVQSIWEWRPQVAILGASKAGKTFFCNALSGIFDKLCLKSSLSTPAGIRQAIKSSSKIILCDEFEQNAHRDEFLEMLRVSGRGDKILRGSSNQKGQSFGLRHIVWVAAVEVGLKREPDRNRFITLELLRPKKENRGKLVLPSPSQLNDLGQRMLAVVIRNIYSAKPLAAFLKDTRVEGVDDRVIESYAVPAAILATIDGMSDERARELLVAMLEEIEKEEAGVNGDDAMLMSAILSAHIHTGRNDYSAAQLIECVLKRQSGWEDAEKALEKCGLKIDIIGSVPGVPEKKQSHACIVIAYNAVSEHLLKSTLWRGQSIDQILSRLEGAVKSRRRVGGHRTQTVLVPMDIFEKKFLGTVDEENEENFSGEPGDGQTEGF